MALTFVSFKWRRASLALLVAMSFGGMGAALWGDGAPAPALEGSTQAVVQAVPVVRLPPLVTEAPSAPSMVARPASVDVQRFDDAAFQTTLREEPLALGAVAVGRPNRGSLFNGARLSDSDPRWKLEVPESSYGTEEAVRGIELAIAEVHRLFPNTAALSIGHLSSKQGGWLRPHRSHQNGRDVDLGFYYRDGSPWYRKATAENLDVPRTWALLSALERAAGIEYAFVDRSLHQVLREHAESIGESKEFIEHMFDGPLPLRGPTIRHERGHLTHLHVRFVSPIAVENAQRLRAFAGKRAKGNVAELLSPRRTKRLVADRHVQRQRAARSGSGRSKTNGNRTKLL